jgi:hypothetical protein
MAQETIKKEFGIYLVLRESGLEIRIPDGDPADSERASLILAHLSLALESLKLAFRNALEATKQ